ncbi:HD domain-containing phosphohydrolase [Pseudomonas sp. 1928-m]|uniref:HD-GYP domain-containing protein n=1 Tax=Pseudomonas sp. 1928-m TaxID=3033804 RepID=UPI0023DFC94A|nr:HD domain-containing phosphohydrolase [Pseudomonas sp. 1928-m]MDF3196905.1 HD domain-containing phosphohydrolase [Pseudomonas sp. 1928-m]
MATPNLAEIPSDLLADFRLESSEQFQRCEQLLIELEHTPDDRERLRELFRLVHTLKGNLGYIGLDTLMSVPQAMEDVLSCLREGQLHFDSLLGDILLLTLDHLKELIQHALGGPSAQLNAAQSKALSQALSALALAPAVQQTGIRSALLQQLDPSSKPPTAIATDEPAAADLLRRYGIEPDADLLFFVDLMQASERRSHFWQGRGLRQLDLALAINQLGGNPEQPEQLAAAICLHDLGMAFLPLEMLHKEAHFNREERRQMQSHPRLAYDLLKRMPRWDAAAEITLQHQEHADGSGYPKGLKEVETSPGALIINIVDTFDARTHERAHQTLNKRPLLRAILEINNLAGRQFSAHWVELFNQTLQQHPELAHR